MPFLEGDVVVRQTGVDRFELVEPIRYEASPQTITVPPGFRTDFASVPRPFVWLLPRYGIYTRAAILHDFLCDETVQTNPVSRAEADRIFLRALRELGTPFVRRWMMWAAVRAGGRLRDSGPLELLVFLVVALPSVLFLLVPTTVILLWLGLFWVIEMIFYVVLKVVSPEPPKQRPRLGVRLDK